MPIYLSGRPDADPVKNKKETRIALIKKSPALNLVLIFILRGVKGLEKMYVLDREEDVYGVLEQFSAVAVEIDQLESSDLLKLSGNLREVVGNYKELIERLSSELTSLTGR